MDECVCVFRAVGQGWDHCAAWGGQEASPYQSDDLLQVRSSLSFSIQ